MDRCCCLEAVALLVAALMGCVRPRDLPDGFLGKAGVFSPDGRSFAFERQNGRDRHLGVYNIQSGRISWIEDGPGCAGLASWGPDGSLIYVYGHVTNTAYQAFKEMGGKAEDGYGIRIWKNGVKRDFTKGRRRDGTPSFSPDGKEVWWVSPEGAGNHRLGQVYLWRAPLGDSSKRVIALTNYVNGNDALVNQPQFSPDGRLIAWAMLDRLRDKWGIRLARAEDPNRNVPVTPLEEIAFEPRWSADGKYLVYSAWKEGDPCWGCYIQEIATGKERRLCDGREPCLSMDGKTLVWTDNDRQHLHFRIMSDADWPHGETIKELDVPKDALPFFVTNLPPVSTVVNIPLDQRFDFGEAVAFYVKVHVEFYEDLKRGRIGFLGARHGRIGESYGIAVTDGKFVADFRDRCYTYFGMETLIPATKGIHEVIIVRTSDRVFISVDGSEPLQQQARQGHLILDKPISLTLGKDLGAKGRVLSCEYGRGWPKTLTHPLSRKEAVR